MNRDELTVKPGTVDGRLLLELRDGRLTLYPITGSDEETRVLLAAVLNHIQSAIKARGVIEENDSPAS
jgi:hypothetical protein